MKINDFMIQKNYVKTRLTSFIIALLFIGLTTSCLDDEPVPEPDPVAYVSFYHMAPVGSLSISLDNNNINSNPFAYTEYTNYLRFLTGERSLKFTPFNASNTLLESEINFVEDNIYSLFITGDSSDLELLVVNDKINFEDSRNPLIRLLHTSPDAPDIKLVFTESEDTTFNNITYKEISNFEVIPSGISSIEIRNADTDDLISTVSNYSFEQESLYTVVVRGYVSNQGDEDKQLSVQVIKN